MAKEIDKFRKIIGLETSLQTIQDLDLLLERILFEARQLTRADSGTIYLKRSNDLVFAYTQNDTKQKELPPGQKLPYSFFTVPANKESISGCVAITKKILNIPDVYKIPPDAPYHFNPAFDRKGSYKTTSVLAIPLVGSGRDCLGVIQVINAMDAEGNVVPFSKDDELFVRHFATVASQALQRAQLTRQILLRMISMAELRDPKETGPHVNRVASVAVELYERWAIRQGMERRKIDRNRDLLRMAAMLHDVGKVAISDMILKKGGPLDKDEYEVMKTHSREGAKLFREKQSEFDEMALQVALTHHENWDGTGYPGIVDLATGRPKKKDTNGQAVRLKEEQIPIFGRVVAVADVFDALSCRRVYKQAWPEDRVLAEMKAMSGKKLDPGLVEIFFEAHGHIKQIYDPVPGRRRVARARWRPPDGQRRPAASRSSLSGLSTRYWKRVWSPFPSNDSNSSPRLLPLRTTRQLTVTIWPPIRSEQPWIRSSTLRSRVRAGSHGKKRVPSRETSATTPPTRTCRPGWVNNSSNFSVSLGARRGDLRLSWMLLYRLSSSSSL